MVYSMEIGLYEKIRKLLNKDNLYWLIDNILDSKAIVALSNKLEFQFKGIRNEAMPKHVLIKELVDEFFVHSGSAAQIIKTLTRATSDKINEVSNLRLRDIRHHLEEKLSDPINRLKQAPFIWSILVDNRKEVSSLVVDALYEIKEGHSDNKSEKSPPLIQSQEIDHKITIIDGIDNDELDADDIEFPDETHHLLQDYTLIREKQQLIELLEEKDREIVRLKRKERKAQYKIEKLRTSTSTKQAKQRSKKEKQGLLQENQKLRQQREEMAKKLDLLPDLQARISQLEEILKQKDKQIEALERELFRLKKAKDQTEQLSSKIALAEEEIASLRVNTINHLSDIIDIQKDFYNNIDRTKDLVATCLEKLQKEKTLLVDRIRKVKDPSQMRCGIFVDVQNMFYAAKKQYKGKLNYQFLLEVARRKRPLSIAVAYIIQTQDVDQSSFIALLEHCGYEVKSKDLKTRIDGSAKGDWDMEMAMDIMSMVDKLDVVVLVSGDGDFVPLVKKLQSYGIIVEVMAFENNTSQELKEVADKYTSMGEELILQC